MIRADCECAAYRKPCAYHEGWADAVDIMTGPKVIERAAEAIWLVDLGDFHALTQQEAADLAKAALRAAVEKT